MKNLVNASKSLRVELLTYTPLTSMSGIGRYNRDLFAHLRGQIDIRVAAAHLLPFADRISSLQNFPIGVQDHQPGAILHFTQIMGCAQTLYRPLRPAVATVHDLGVLVCPEDSQSVNGINRRILDVQLAGLKRMDAWIADSHATAQDLITCLGCPPERVHAIHMSIDNARYRPIEDAYLMLPEGARFRTDRHDVYLLYVGNELPRKNLGSLLKALKILKDSGSRRRPRLIKVGSLGGARWREQFAHQVESLGLADDVLILGQIDEALLPLLYNAADAFVTTSVMEGFGYPLLEAMACGTPVIASRSGSLPEIGGDAPIWIDDPRDPSCIADALALFIDTPQHYTAMRTRGLAQAARFTPEAWINQIIKVYQSVS